VSRTLAILFLLLGLAVATREIPELYNLADNPSNDGQVFHSPGQTRPRIRHRVENEERVLPASPIGFVHIENLSYPSIVPARTGQDILRLVGSLRT
jgi:hypothetical protein